MEIVKVTWVLDAKSGYQKYLTGELVFEDADFVHVKGLKDGTVFEIKKSLILELQRGVRI